MMPAGVRIKRFWVASAYSVRAGYHHGVMASCGHEHRGELAARRCCDVMRRTRKSPTRIGWRWRPDCIELWGVPSALREGKARSAVVGKVQKSPGSALPSE